MTRIGKYDIKGELGRGGMGVVYRAYDTALDREVAIKVISEPTVSKPEAKERFYREARTAARLSHENITVVYDVGETDGKPYIVMEYLAGSDLRESLDRTPGLTSVTKLEYAVQVCRGLAYSHSCNVIHRDIKPANIRILDHGRVKLMDFGIAKPASGKIDATTTVIGTPSYMSPEQIRGLIVDKRSDVFSFGVVFFEMVTGRLPFNGDQPLTIMYKIVNEEPEPIGEIQGIPREKVSAVIERALQKDPEARYQTFDHMGKDIEAILYEAVQGERKGQTMVQSPVEMLMEESKSLLRQNNLAAARRVAEKALRLDPRDATVLRLIAKIKESEQRERNRPALEKKLRELFKSMDQQDHQRSLKLIDEIAAIDPSHQEIERFRVQIEETMAAAQEEKNFNDLISSVRGLIRRKQFGNAEKALEHAKSLRPGDPLLDQVRQELANAQADGKKESDDLKLARLEEALRREPMEFSPGNPEAKPQGSQAPRRQSEGKRGTSKTPLVLFMVLLLGIAVGMWYYFLGEQPVPTGHVALIALPWAEVTKIEKESDGSQVDHPRVSTPCRLELPEGKYRIHLFSSQYTKVVVISLEVRAGAVQSVVERMPGYDVDEILGLFP